LEVAESSKTAEALGLERFAKFWRDWRLVRAPWRSGWLQGLSSRNGLFPDPRWAGPKIL
jgi:hypothetical protein